MRTLSLEETIFGRTFIRRTMWCVAILLATIVVGNIIFVIMFPQSPLFLRFQFDIDQEGNWTTWYNSTLDMAAGVAAFAVAWLKKRTQGSFSRPWLVIGAMLVYIGMDDASQIHEHTHGLFATLTTTLARWIPSIQSIGWFLWIPLLGIPASIALVSVAWVVYRDIRSNRLARLLFVAGIALLLSNPITEYMQGKLTQPRGPLGAPQFADQLYETDHAAWLQLQVIDLTQEATEIVAVECMLVAFLLTGEDLVAIQSTRPLSLRFAAQNLGEGRSGDRVPDLAATHGGVQQPPGTR